jgi:hypothetical protein
VVRIPRVVGNLAIDDVAQPPRDRDHLIDMTQLDLSEPQSFAVEKLVDLPRDTPFWD